MVFPSALSQTTPYLLNRYRIQQPLGARLGRRTLLGYDYQRSCPVIIKYLCFDDPIQSSDTKRFRQEIAAIKALDHPSIPSYCDSFEIHDHGYHGLMLVQDYIVGQSLYALVNNNRVFSESEVRSLASQILEILDYLHNQQPAIIHRDIKPSSFVLQQSPQGMLGKVYLVDFGLVQSDPRPQSIVDQPILISGTPGYRPPEQLGDRAVPATDLYSLGATLVHLATGKHPKTLPQRGLRILFGHELGHMNRPFKSWLRWLTQPKQHKRPSSAHLALRGLERAEQIFDQPQQRLSNLSVLIQHALLKAIAPADTQIKLIEYSQTLEVLLPPLGWQTRSFVLAFCQVMGGCLGLGLAIYGVIYLGPHLAAWQRLLSMVMGGFGGQFSARLVHRGIRAMLQSLFRQVSIQLLPDIMLLGYRFPCRPVNYQINTYRQDVDDIDLQPGSSTINFVLRRNRTIVGKLDYVFSAAALGLTSSDIVWINDILQLWLKQRKPELR